ncbi:MAG: hypothetical protein CVU22_02430 [Betaproteobacteria bacterium HGW-Betaproteobacteria-16]|nr:MAG: hypothetical protein CVU22_02430 [Betaproteobacteria bacterium HGW-Betaproteobacteria-16]
MTGGYFNPDWRAKVTVPVKRVGDHWEFFYGGDVPVREGTLGELTINADGITDEDFRKRVSQELVIKILHEGARLHVALSDQSKKGARVGKWPEVFPPSVPPGTTRFECVTLGPSKPKSRQMDLVTVVEPGGLWLKLKGLERTELVGSTVLMPSGFATQNAISLNHALTLLSQAYETHRISNTGNVYTRLFYEEPGGRWFPLNDLREGVQAVGERKLLNDTWQHVEQVLGWRPTSPKKGKRK